MAAQHDRESPSYNWLEITGLADPERASALSARVQQRIQSGAFKKADCDYIKRLPARLTPGDLQLSDLQLERLRQVCQRAEVQLMPMKITSHRRWIGPIIVASKRILFSILKVLLKDTIRRQNDFNSAVISYLAASAQKPSEPNTAPTVDITSPDSVPHAARISAPPE
jgi:hypothetical protein